MADREHARILRAGRTAWNEWRTKSDILPDLRSTDLRNLDLRGFNFRGVNFGMAELNDSNLDGTILTAANFWRANLRGANLSHTNLEHSNLWRAILTGANVRGAEIGFAAVTNIDLSQPRNLRSVTHTGPSTIGIDTLRRTAESLESDSAGLDDVVAFLKGAGLDDLYIDQFKGSLQSPIGFYSCFISYSHEDKAFARKLHDHLQGRGIRCWLDEHQILPGDDIYEQIDRGIRLWDKILLCCSKSSLTSWWVDNEISTAFTKEQRLMRERKMKVFSLVPLNLDGFMFSPEWANGKAQQVRSRLAADFTEWSSDEEKFRQNLEKVIQALRDGDSGREPPPRPKI